MTRPLKLSGFVGLTVQMLWGMYNVFVLSPQGPGMSEPFEILIGAHAHLGVLSILAVVLGFAVDHYGIGGSRRTVVTWFFIAGQWLLPASFVAVAAGYGIAAITAYLWGILLLVAMALMAWTAWSETGDANVA